MFEGRVTHHSAGWDAWIRTIVPEEVVAIRDDLERLITAESDRRTTGVGAAADPDADDYVGHYLRSALEFIAGLAVDGRGMVYMIEAARAFGGVDDLVVPGREDEARAVDFE